MGTSPRLTKAGEKLQDPKSSAAQKSKAGRTLGKHGAEHKKGTATHPKKKG